MSKRKKNRSQPKQIVAQSPQPSPPAAHVPHPSDTLPTPDQQYEQAREFAATGQTERARQAYHQVEPGASTALKSIIWNDLGVLAAADGNVAQARAHFATALEIDPGCELARQNLALIDAGSTPTTITAAATTSTPSPAPATTACKVAILSLLFNWPTTGGGNVHTTELALFLGRAGYSVRHFFAHFPPWGIGEVADTPFPAERLSFRADEWTAPTIQARFQQAVSAFQPDFVLVTDSWNMKPLLAEAVQDFAVIWRLQAMECLCPLNNVRLLVEADGTFRQCPKHQLATYSDCAQCVSTRGQQSGDLHRAERALSGVGTAIYEERLRRTLRQAKAVLVVNPLTEALISPYATDVRVVTAGMDPARFPWPPTRGEILGLQRPRRLLFAGLVHEWMKGYHFLHSTCQNLWQKRQDFELLATGDPAGQVDAFTRFVGWRSQAELPGVMQEADILVIPALSQEALGRTAVEAMAAGLPVVASRLGGLPATVAEGATGLLFDAGSTADLARKLEKLLDDPELACRMGRAGRARFEELYDWNVIIQRDYVPLLGPPQRSEPLPANGSNPSSAVAAPAQEVAIRRFQDRHAWPTQRPVLESPPRTLGWLQDGARELLAQELSSTTRLVVEVGAWLGLSTRYIADHAPQARVVTIDHWQGSPEHQRNPEWRALLPTLFQSFQSLCWDYRERIIPVRQSSQEGLREVAAQGLVPEVIYLDCDHSYEATRADLELAFTLFPGAVLIGDDYDEPGVCDAVTGFAARKDLIVETAGQIWRAWRIRQRP